MSGEETTPGVPHLFVFIGATPNTDFLPDSVVMDEKGFVCTGDEMTRNDNAGLWRLDRPPFPWKRVAPAYSPRATSGRRRRNA